MTKFQCHYESLKVTRDAPAEVIRAAYRSLSQKHHPDKNSGNEKAAQVMARLNFAYSVLSDAEQRKLYDLQILRRQRGREAHFAYREAAHAGSAPEHAGNGSADTFNNNTTNNSGGALFNRMRRYAMGRNGQIGITVLGVVVIVLVIIFSLIRKEQQAMLLLQQAAIYASDHGDPLVPNAPPQDAADKAPAAKPSGVEAFQIPPPSNPQAVAPAPAPKAPEAPPAPPKASEFERLTAMLKSMGLGLHKLDLSTPPQGAKQPPMPAPPAEAAKAAVTATTSAAPSRLATAAQAAPPPTERAREEFERPAATEVPRADAKPLTETGRASAAPTASTTSTASTSAARHPVIADTRACAPTYPANAYSNGETGTVQLALLVNGDGKVVESKVQKSSGYPELDKAARRALSQCKFKFPGNERPAEPAWANLEYVFSLD